MAITGEEIRNMIEEMKEKESASFNGCDGNCEKCRLEQKKQDKKEGE